MMVVSFSWLTPSFIADRKSVTRRQWTPEYAKRFKPRDICQGYDKQPRFGGKRIGLFDVNSLTWEDISDMPQTDYEAEGFKFMEEQGLKIWNKSPRVAFDVWRDDGGWYWVLRFKKVVE